MAKRALLGLITIVLLLILSSILQLAGAESHPTSAITQLSNPRISESAATPSPWWQNEIVDERSDWATGGSTSLTIDRAGNPHIGYSEATNETGALRYARWNGSSWELKVVDGDDSTFSPSMRLDSAEYPRIAYAHSPWGLRYARWDGSRWWWETVDTEWTSYVSLVLGNDDHPGIGYQDTYRHDLKYARWDGTTWQIQTVDSAGNVGAGASLVLDAAENPHFSYYDETNGSLKYARWDGWTWQIESVDATGFFWPDGSQTALEIDSAGHPHISYYDATNKDLRYAHWDGSAWRTEIVDSAGDIGKSSSLRLDGDGNPHIAYGDSTLKLVKYAHRNNGRWAIEVVDSDTLSWGASIALNSGGCPRISYIQSYACGYWTCTRLMFAQRLVSPTAPNHVQLPLVMKQPTMTPTNTPSPTPTSTSSPAGIYGRVTQDGAPAAGISLKLRSWTGSTYLDVASATTNASGTFSFVGIPSAPSGQEYSVSCGGQGAGTLLYWTTGSLDDYAAGSSVHIGDFDIADVALVSPADRATVSLPAEFRWTPRPASPTDSYVWAIFNPSSYWPWYWGPSLGYTGSYTRYSLPSGFNFGAQYTWYVEIHSPDGGSGASRERRGVTFSSAVATGSQVR